MVEVVVTFARRRAHQKSMVFEVVGLTEGQTAVAPTLAPKSLADVFTGVVVFIPAHENITPYVQIADVYAPKV